MGLIKRRLILFRVFIKTHCKENFFEPHLDLRRSAAPDIIHEFPILSQEDIGDITLGTKRSPEVSLLKSISIPGVFQFKRARS